MMKVFPVNMISAPNFWAPTTETYWQVTAGIPVVLWGQLGIVDQLGTRPYVPAAGATLAALFQRGDFIGSITNQNLSVTKTATLDPNFRALINFSLSAADATNVMSGTVVFTLVEGGTTSQQWVQNWFTKKFNCTAGF